SVRRKTPRDGPGRLRIIGGGWRGRRLELPPRPDLRPTPDPVRETVFNWPAQVLPAARSLHLFAGRGCLGLEALSRGAAEAWLVEVDPVLARVLTENVARLGANARVVRDDARRFLRRRAHGAVRPDARPEVRPDARPEVRPDARPDVRPDALADLLPEDRPDDRLGDADDQARFDVVFLDPPYREPIEPWLALVAPVLERGGLIYVERPLPAGLPSAVE